MENNSNNTQVATEGKIDVTEIVAKLKRNWWLFAISVFACLCLAGVYLYAKHSLFSIHAKVLVTYDDGTGSMGSTFMQSLSLGGVGGSGVEDEILVMGAHSIKAQTISELKLNRSYSSPDGLLRTRYYYNDSPIEIDAPAALFDTLSTSMTFNIEANEDLSKISVKVKKGRFKTLAEAEASSLPMVVNTPYGIFSIDTTKYYVPNEEIEVKVNVSGNSIAAEGWSQLISVGKSEKKSNGISMYIEDINIQRGKDFLNKMIELYNRRGQAEKDEMAINTGKFIEERLEFLYQDLSASEEKLEKFKKQSNITDLKADAAILLQKANSLDEKLVEAETEFEILKLNRDFLADPENKYSMIPNVSGTHSGSLSAYNSLILQYFRLQNNAKANNAILKSTEAQIDAMRENIIETINKSYETAKLKLDELKRQNNLAKSQLNIVPTHEREYLELLREQSIRNTLYSFLLQKREENQLVLAATTPKGKIVDEAFAYNEPIAPKKLMVIIIALFFGLMIPALWLYVKPMLSDKFDSIEALKRLTALPILGEICHSRSANVNPVVVSEKSTRPIAELFRLLRSNLGFMLPATSTSGNVVTITSSCSGEGKTFVAMNVAESLALLGKKVELIGMDIRLPMLAQNLGLPSAPGVTNYLSDDTTTIDSLIQRSNNCDVIVAGPVPPNPSELLLSERVNVLIEDLKKQYDYVVIDSAPIGLVSDTFSLTKYTDVTLYVTRANYTKRGFIKYLNTIVSRGQLKNVAVVVNDTNPNLSHGYGYGYGSKQED